MNTLKLKRFWYHVRHDYLTLNNVVVAAAVLIALSWAWGSIESMQRNYELQQMVDQKKYQLTVEKLRTELLAYESKYYESDEYLDLAVRQRLGRGSPGEKLLIVPSTDAAKQQPTAHNTPQKQSTSNFQQWVNFLFGARRTSQNLQK